MTQLTQGPEPRYGKALFELAVENKKQKAFAKDAASIKTAIQNSKELQTVLTSPLISNAQKSEILEKIIKKLKITGDVANFIKFVANKGRAEILAGMLEWFETYLSAYEGKVNAKVISAQKLTAAQQKEISKFVLAQVKGSKTVNLDQEVDEKAIGGFKVTVGSTEFDATVQGKLNSLRSSLIR